METKPIKSLNHKTIKKVFQYVQTILMLDERKEFEMLSLILKEEYFRYHGLKAPAPPCSVHLKNMKTFRSVIIDYKNLGRYVSFSQPEIRSIYESFT